jgi:hypothetical protein
MSVYPGHLPQLSLMLSLSPWPTEVTEALTPVLHPSVTETHAPSLMELVEIDSVKF